MVYPICKNNKRIRDLTRPDSVRFSAIIDDKGRISIPADIRKTICLNKGDSLGLFLSVSDRSVLLRNGCSGPMVNRRAEGASVRSKTSDCGSDNLGSNPSCGPRRKVIKYE